jgi:nitrogen fixation-related uncharacterized protein
MNIAAMLLFAIWCGFVVVLVMGWAIKSTFEQVQDIEMSEEDNDNVR